MAANHVADLITQDAASSPDQLWDHLVDTSGFTAKGISRDTFAAFLQTTEGKAFLDERKSAARAGMAKDVERCVRSWTKSQAECVQRAADRKSYDGCFSGH